MKNQTKITVLSIASILLISIFIKEVDASNLMDFDFSKITKTQTNIEKAPTDSAGVVDENLKAALNQELNKRDGTTRPDTQDITIQEMESFIGNIDLNSKDISDLTGLEYMHNVQVLCLFDNPGIKSLYPISNLKQLEYLQLKNCNIDDKDLEELKRLTNLKSLYLYDNQISNIEPLSELTKLENLYLYNNKITNIDPLRGLINLEDLRLQTNKISNVNALSDMKNLKHLNMENNQISDLRPIKEPIPRLLVTGQKIQETLQTGDTPSKYTVFDETSTPLDVSLTLSPTGVYEGDFISDSGKFTGHVTVSKVIDIPDANLKKALNEIYFLQPANTNITQGQMESLTNIRLYNKQIEELTGLEYAINLTNVLITWNKIENIDALSNLKKIKKLELNGNKISDITPLSGLTNLTYLDIEYNLISDLRALQGLSITTLKTKEQKIEKDFGGADHTVAPTFSAYDIDGAELPVDFGTPVVGNKDYNGSFKSTGASDFSGTIKLKNYGYDSNLVVDLNRPTFDLTSPQSVNLNEKQSNEDLKVLFDIKDISDNKDNLSIDDIKVDQSKVKYDIPGNYKLIFTLIDSDGNETIKEANLEVKPIINIPDDNLRKALNQVYFSQPANADITQGQMESLTGSLELPNEKISNITGLEYATNLTNIKLNNNLISDITPLSGLTNLISLNLSSNEIKILSDLSKLNNLHNLSLEYNNIIDLTPLSGLTNIEYLYLNNNQISDLRPLSNLTTLKKLELFHNPISDASVLNNSNLSNLEHLDLSHCEITTVPELSKLTNLKILYLNSNKLNDNSSLENLNNLNNLDQVSLSNNNISDLTPLSGLPKLKGIVLENNQVSDISPLNNLTSLEIIRVDYNQISDLSLLKLPNLNKITASDQKIKIYDKVSHTNDKVSPFIAHDIDDTTYEVDLGEIKEGTNYLKGEWDNKKNNDVVFTGTVEYTYTYNPLLNSNEKPRLRVDDNKTINLNELKTNDELIDLFKVSAFDFEDRNIINQVIVDQSNVKYDKVGTYDIVFSVSDKSSNIATKTSKLNVIDSDVPIINSLDRLDIKAKKPLSDDELKSLFKVSASDNYDGDITSNVVVNQSKVNYDIPGVYDVVFSVVDSAGNRTDKKVFLKILSNEVPVLKGVEDIEVINGSDFNPMDGVSANDYEDGDITGAIDVYSKDLKDCLSTIYNYSVTDSDGNVVDVNRTVRYVSVPNNKPVIDGVDNTDIFVGEDFDPMDGVSANDYEDGDLSSSISLSGSINNKVLGDYTLTYSVVDSDNNIVSVDRIISVKDIVVSTNNKPIITGANGVKVKLGSDFDIMEGIVASDVEDGDLSNNIIVVRNELDTSIVGDYKIVYSVSDSDSNISNVSRTISVYDEGNKVNNKVDNNNKNNIDKDNKTTIVKKLIETGKSSIYFIFVSVLLFLAYLIQIKKINIMK